MRAPGYRIQIAMAINAAGQIVANGYTPTDPTHYHALLLRPIQLNRFAYAWANQPTAEAYIPAPDWAYSASGGLVSIHRTGVGAYQVSFPNLPGGLPHLSSIPAVTTYGSSTKSCALAGYSTALAGSVAAVSCTDLVTKSAADSEFTILLVGNDSLPALTGFAMTGGAAPLPPLDPDTTFSTARLPITVSHGALAGDYDVFFGTGNTPRSAKLVTAAAGGGAVCNDVQSISGGLQVRCYDKNGVASDQPFSAIQIPAGRSGRRAGFAFANSSNSASYTPTTSTSYNSSGGAITASRFSAGRYAMTFAGLEKLPGHTEQVQVTAMGSSLRTCNVVNWGNAAGGLRVVVECRDASAQLADARYGVLVIE